MNGWDPAEPAWWLNLQAHPQATVDLVGGSRSVTARRAVGAERERLWAALHDYAGYGDLDAFAKRRGGKRQSWSSPDRPHGDRSLLLHQGEDSERTPICRVEKTST